MSSSNDNAMARFLFAILRQKNLKDVDWNKVATDPVLAQPISNGHAARMRYHRFRSSMLGLEPQRRNRPTAGKSRVTKPKKDGSSAKTKTETGEAVSETAELGSVTSTGGNSAFRVKEESMQSQDMRLPPGGPTTGMFSETQVHFSNRLMTPCSDTDAMAAPQGYAGSPASDLVHPDSPFDFAHLAQMPDERGYQQHSAYQAFDAISCELDYPSGYTDHNTQQSGNVCVPGAVMEPDSLQLGVKHEDWETQFSI